MTEEFPKYEYRVDTIHSEAEIIEATLNEWGKDGWETMQLLTCEGNPNSIRIIARRHLTGRS